MTITTAPDTWRNPATSGAVLIGAGNPVLERLHREHVERVRRLHTLKAKARPGPVQFGPPLPPVVPAVNPVIVALQRRQVSKIVIDLAADHFGIKRSTLVGSGRFRKLVRARHIVMLILREQGYSMPRIGRMLGNRDHTTVLHGIRKATARITASDEALDAYDTICSRLEEIVGERAPA